jgi:nucleotide-binding universal stress UspA family protein
MFGRILVPLDGSRLAEAALPPAERLAAAFGSMLVLLHVLERARPRTVHGERHFTEAAPAAKYLGRLAADLAARSVRAAVHVHDQLEADVAASTAAHGAAERADLIVLCTHGRGGVRRALWGSVAERVLRRSRAPVLLARVPAPGAPPAFAPATVVVPLDATPASEAALRPAAALAARLGATLHLTTVVATPGTVPGERRAAARLLPRATRALLDLEVEQARAYLAGLAARLRRRGVPVETEVRRGAVVAELIGEAAEHGPGLVVAVTDGLAGLPALWSGSTAAGLLARTNAPVMPLPTRRDRPAGQQAATASGCA